MSEEVEKLKLEIKELREELRNFKEEVRKNYKQKEVYLGGNIGGVLGDAGW